MATDAERLGKTVVIDYGSDTIKAGKARDVPSEHALSCITPSVVELRTPQHADAASGPGGAPWRRSEVVKRGRIVAIDQFESLLHHVLYDRMRWRYGREECLVIAEPVLCSRAEREAIVQLAFEAFSVRGYYVCDAAACALYSCNKQVGLSVDVGHGKAVVAAVTEGATHVAGAAQLAWAGEDLDAYLARMLAASGAGRAAAGQLGPEQLRCLKEQIACVAASADDYRSIAGGGARVVGAEVAAAAAAADKQQQQNLQQHAEEWRRQRGAFTLPDGQVLNLTHEGYSLGEALMRPQSAGVAAPTLGEVCCDVVAQHMEASSRKTIWENVLVSGATGAMPGFKERLLAELPLVGPSSASFGLVPMPNYMPSNSKQHAAWMGATVLARVAMHQCITANEYDEFGPAVVGRIA